MVRRDDRTIGRAVVRRDETNAVVRAGRRNAVVVCVQGTNAAGGSDNLALR